MALRPSMTPNEYQEFCKTTWVHDAEIIPDVAYATLGLVGEAGEVAEKVKKLYRDGAELDVNAIVLELGDVLYYLARLADELGISLQQVIEENVVKLRRRQLRDALHGNGDDR